MLSTDVPDRCKWPDRGRYINKGDCEVGDSSNILSGRGPAIGNYRYGIANQGMEYETRLIEATNPHLSTKTPFLIAIRKTIEENERIKMNFNETNKSVAVWE